MNEYLAEQLRAWADTLTARYRDLERAELGYAEQLRVIAVDMVTTRRLLLALHSTFLLGGLTPSSDHEEIVESEPPF